jgi:hypothetical protein
MNSGGSDSIESGDRVTGRVIDPSYWNSRFHFHRFKEYIIVHKEGILVKQIIDHDVEKGIIKIHSTNPDKALYPDDDLKLEDIRQILNVVEVSKKR